jgi:site-specific DNA recombinase
MTAKSTFIYCRISEDRAGRSEGVGDQERQGREYAAIHWPGIPVRVFSDNSITAAKEDVIRPEFEKMREAIRRGECAHLWAVSQSRLARLTSTDASWFSLAAELVKAGITEVHTRHDGILRVDDVAAGVKAVFNANEARVTSKLIRAKKEELARQGRPDGALGFGYRQRIYTPEEQARLEAWQAARLAAVLSGADMGQWKEDHPRPQGGRKVTDEQGRASAEIVPEEAEIIRQAAAKMLGGWGLTNVAMWLRETGVRGKLGAPFTPTTVGQFLTAPSIAGFRVQRGEIIGKGTWEPILDEGTWRALCATIGAAKRGPQIQTRRYLLGRHLMTCECGARMRGTMDRRREPAGLRYVCRKVDGGCSEVTIATVAVDAYVAGELFLHLDDLKTAGLLAGDGFADRRAELVAELQILSQKAEDLSAMWNADKITTVQFDKMNTDVKDKQRRLGVELAGLPAPLDDVDPAVLRVTWPRMTLEEKQKLIGGYIERIVFHRQAKARPTISDVARKAGVTYDRARYVFLGRGFAEVADAVLAAAAELGYTYQPGQPTRISNFDEGRVEIIWRARS